MSVEVADTNSSVNYSINELPPFICSQKKSTVYRPHINGKPSSSGVSDDNSITIQSINEHKLVHFTLSYTSGQHNLLETAPAVKLEGAESHLYWCNGRLAYNCELLAYEYE